MTDISLLLERIERGEPEAASQLLPLVYDELRSLARSHLAGERPGHTLQATALVHEAWLRLTRGESAEQNWDGRGHFFAAAAESMRRILVESARRKARLKRGGDLEREDVDLVELAAPQPYENLVELDEALDRLRETEPEAVQLVHLRYFAGLTQEEAAQAMKMPLRSAERLWAYAKAWLLRELCQ